MVDGDASGHRGLLARLARETGVGLLWVHNPSQSPPSPEAGLDLEARRVDAASQAVDLEIMNAAGPGDIVVTGDLGLAMVCVAKGAAAISPRGFWYRAEELERRMEYRELAARLRRDGYRLDAKPPKVRLDDWRFEAELRRALAP